MRQRPTFSQTAFVAGVAALLFWCADASPAEQPKADEQESTSGDGQKEKSYWALQPVEKPELPALENASWPRNPIDRFILARLEEAGLEPAPPAERRTLIRRVCFDLTGLPPTPEQVEAFVNDDAPGAYRRLVDRLLASPRYGEQWARHWLDVVRFAESNGFERDRIREHAWRYRDWVIGAFNENLPYADFIREQLAGDALHPGEPRAAVPTGFLMTGPYDDVDNRSVLEEKRKRANELDEFVKNTGAAFLGLTVGCARCHDHKFDPIPTEDYYRLTAVFSGVHFGDRTIEPPAEAERRAKLNRQLKSVSERLQEIDKQLTKLAGAIDPKRNEETFEPVEARFVRITITRTTGGTEPAIDEIEIYGPDSAENLALASGAEAAASSLLPGYEIHQIEHLNDGKAGNDHSWISNEKNGGWAQIELPRTVHIDRIVWGRDRKGQYTDRLAAEYRLEYSRDGETFHELPVENKASSDGSRRQIAGLKSERKRLRERLRSLQSQLDALGAPEKAWAAVSQQTEPRRVLKRGDVRTPGAPAPPRVLGCIGRLDPKLRIEKTDSGPERRRKLAAWIAHRDNPLTWRVMVNRLWHYHFGTGLVETPSNFGSSGGRPSHPELLDWLAARFRDSGGDIKALHRLILLSSTYRQTSGHSERAAEVDAENRLLWRMPRRRLRAEEIRDAMLQISGRLDPQMGGPSYRTFDYIPGNIPEYKPVPEEEGIFRRRTVYRHVVRTHGAPFLETFDCPNPSVMTPDRSETTTPLQALSLLNNAFVLKQAEFFADRVRREAGSDLEAQIHRAFQLALQREPRPEELAKTVAFADEHGLPGLCRVLFNTNGFLYVD